MGLASKTRIARRMKGSNGTFMIGRWKLYCSFERIFFRQNLPNSFHLFSRITEGAAARRMRLSVSPGANAACSSLLRGEVGMYGAHRLALRASRDSDCLKHPPLLVIRVLWRS